MESLVMSTASLRQLLYVIQSVVQVSSVTCADMALDISTNLCFTALCNRSLSANTLRYVHIYCLS
jgi:hypothetical protein